MISRVLYLSRNVFYFIPSHRSKASKCGAAFFSTFPNAEMETVVTEKEDRLCQILGSKEPVPLSEFHTVLRALAHSNLPDAALRAERWLRYLQMQATPDEECYLHVLTAWKHAAFHEDPSRVVARAEQWFDKCPSKTTRLYNVYLDILTSGRALKNGRNNQNAPKQFAEKAERLLKEHMIPHQLANVESFNFCIRGWNRCRRDGEVAERAIHLLRLMERHQYTPNGRSFGLIMDAIANRAKLKVQCQESRSHGNGWDDYRLLQKILHSFAQPTTYEYNVLLNCLANLAPIYAAAPSEAESILCTLIAQAEETGVRPDTISYNTILKCLANSKQRNRGERILYWLRKMWTDYEYSGHNKPDTQTYNMALRALVSLKRPQTAEELLEELLQRGDSIPADSESYSFCIRAWLQAANDGSEYALQKAEKWMRELLDYDNSETSCLKFNEGLLSLYLSAARKCASRAPWILQDVTQFLSRIRDSRRPLDATHYTRWLQIGLLAYSKPERNDERDEFIQTVIAEVKDQGLVSAHLIRALGNGPIYETGWTAKESDRVFLLHFPYWPMPTIWTRNVKKGPPTKYDMQRTEFQVFHHGDDPYREKEAERART